LIKHDSTKNVDILRKYVELSIKASKKSPDLIIWPETALPGYFFDKRMTYKAVTNLVKYVNTPLLTGLCRRDISPDYYLNYYNSAGLIEPGGNIVSLYDKMHLVMFGEYVPYENIFPFLKLVTPIDGSFSCGSGARTLALTIKTNTFEFGPLICFEDVFGYVAREMSRAGADILVNLTNDGWFHNSPEPYQHAALAAFRAIETRRPLIRSTNSGITTYINRFGKIKALLKENGKSVDVSGIMCARIPVYNRKNTLYTKFGDWFLIGWCIVTGGLFIGTLKRNQRISKN
ncbi:MAG: apolipoprotein N-acyltransferase, partial [Chlamydiae bacterium]